MAGGGGAGGAAGAATDGEPQPVGYRLGLTWSPSSRTLDGTEAITLRNAGPGTLPRVWLRLWPNDSIAGQADGCRYPGLVVRRVLGARVGRYAVACSAVSLTLDQALQPGEAATVRLRFRTRVPTDESLLGRSAGVDLLGRAVPLLAVRDATGWHLNPDTAIGDPAFSLSAAWHATISVPAALGVASTGVQVSDRVDRRTGRRVVVTGTPHARDFGLAVGHMLVRTGTTDGVRVRVFAGAGTDRSRAQRALRSALLAVHTYTSWFGPYGSPELDVVLAALGEDSQELPEIVFTDADRGTVAHEVSHQWWYSTVGDDQWNQPWLDESFASWSEEQLMRGTYACDPARPLGAHRGGLRYGLGYYEHRPSRYVDVIYRGGACALIALEDALGRARFRALLRDEVRRYRDGVVTTAGFLALLRAADPVVARRWEALVGFPAAGTTQRSP